jgi:hypothetical protein
MGKKAKTKTGQLKRLNRKKLTDVDTLPPPPRPLEEEVSYTWFQGCQCCAEVASHLLNLYLLLSDWIEKTFD